MKQRASLLTLIIPVLTGTFSCDRTYCENKNPIFYNYDITSPEYNSAFVEQIETIGQKNLTYWFDHYFEENGEESMVVRIRHKSFCAKGIIRVKDWNKIEGIRRTRGVGYVGAELRGLTLHVEKACNRTVLVYKDITRIID